MCSPVELWLHLVKRDITYILGIILSVLLRLFYDGKYRGFPNFTCEIMLELCPSCERGWSTLALMPVFLVLISLTLAEQHNTQLKVVVLQVSEMSLRRNHLWLRYCTGVVPVLWKRLVNISIDARLPCSIQFDISKSAHNKTQLIFLCLKSL